MVPSLKGRGRTMSRATESAGRLALASLRDSRGLSDLRIDSSRLREILDPASPGGVQGKWKALLKSSGRVRAVSSWSDLHLLADSRLPGSVLAEEAVLVRTLSLFEFTTDGSAVLPATSCFPLELGLKTRLLIPLVTRPKRPREDAEFTPAVLSLAEPSTLGDCL